MQPLLLTIDQKIEPRVHLGAFRQVFYRLGPVSWSCCGSGNEKAPGCFFPEGGDDSKWVHPGEHSREKMQWLCCGAGKMVRGCVRKVDQDDERAD